MQETALNFLAGGAVLGVVAALWGKIKTFAWRGLGLFVQRVEIPTDIVNAEIDRVAKDYSRSARIPGFRPGKAPARVIKQRYRDQILHDVAHDLIPRAIDNALRERGVEAVEPPDVRDVTVDEGQPLTFTASFDTVPPFEPGDYAGVSLTRRPGPRKSPASQIVGEWQCN